MKIRVSTSTSSKAIRIRFVTAGNRGTLPSGIRKEEFAGQQRKLVHHHAENAVFIGLGDEPTPALLRDATAIAISHLKRIGATEAVLELGAWSEHAQAIAEAALLADFRFEDFKRSKSAAMRSLDLICDSKKLRVAKQAVERARRIGDAINRARQIANQPGNIIYPETLANEVRQLAKGTKLKVTVLDESALRKGNFGGLIAVGQGSARPPRLIVIEHGAPSDRTAPIALVGKAITFDTGGISIKPAAKMEEMVFDKCGGLVVLGTMLALSALQYPKRVVGLIAAAENMPGARAYRPGDIITMYNGSTVEVVNTDAEGRLVLGDAIAYARDVKKARAIVDLATLTGACGVALGEYTAGLWSNNDQLLAALRDAAAAADEAVWPMPLFEEFDKDMESEVAVLKNAGGRLGGACTGAAFLKHFAGDTPWAHLDIAFAAALSKPRHGIPAGATGFGIRTLIKLLETWA